MATAEVNGDGENMTCTKLILLNR